MVLDDKSDSFGRSKSQSKRMNGARTLEKSHEVVEEAGEVERLPMEGLVSL